MTSKLITFCAVLSIGLFPLENNTIEAQELFVGLAEENITPPVGYPHYRGISTGVHDSLYAKAIYFRQGDVEAVLVECDLLWVSRDLSNDVRLAVQEETGIPFQNMIIAGTHSHTSPAYDGDILELNEHVRKEVLEPKLIDGMEYPEWLRNQITGAIIKAKESSQSTRLEVGRGEIDDISFNRRYLMANGEVHMNPGSQNPAAICPMGPIDPEVGMLTFRGKNGNPEGVLVNFAVHTDTKGGTEFSADFPAFLNQSLSEEFGSDFFTFYGQGACGNLNHFNTRTKSQLSSEEIGENLAKVVKDRMQDLKTIQYPHLAVETEVVFAPLQNFTEEELAWALDRDAPPLYDESDFFDRRRPMKIRSLQRMREKEAIPPTVPSGTWHLPVEIQVFRISDEIAIVGLPGELYVEHGVAIKEASPFPLTMVIELTNSHIAYVPTKNAFPQGGYTVINSRLAPGGGEMMVEAAVRLLNDLH